MMVKSEPERFFVVDGTKSREEIAAVIWQKVKTMLRAKKQSNI